MHELKYSYAEDEQGNYIHIDKAIKGNSYYDIVHLKNGERIPMIVKGGEKKDSEKNRRKHYSHYPDFPETEAHYESYIHQAWKKWIKEQFDGSKQFVSKLYVYKPWEKEVILHTLDLKERFDTCEIETRYDGFVPDLKLSNSKHPEWDTVFIEIFYKHECSREKIESGKKIIEIKVDDDKEISLSLKEGYSRKLIENLLKYNTANPYAPTNIPPIRFYNFPRVLQPPIGRFSVIKEAQGFPKGKYEVLDDYWMEAALNHDCNSLMDITMPADVVAKQPDDYMRAFYATALKNKIPVVHCLICFTNIIGGKCPNIKKGAEVCDHRKIRYFDIGRFGELLRNKKHEIWINHALFSYTNKESALVI